MSLGPGDLFRCFSAAQNLDANSNGCLKEAAMKAPVDIEELYDSVLKAFPNFRKAVELGNPVKAIQALIDAPQSNPALAVIKAGAFGHLIPFIHPEIAQHLNPKFVARHISNSEPQSP